MNIEKRLQFCTELLYHVVTTKSIIDPSGLDDYIDKTTSEILDENKKDYNVANRKFGKIVDGTDFNDGKQVDSAIKKSKKVVKSVGAKVNKKDAYIVSLGSEDVWKKNIKLLSRIAGVDYTFDIKDTKAIDRINKFQDIFIYDHYKDEVTEQVSNRIRDLIVEEEGALDSTRIARKLKREFKDIIHQKNYFNIVVNQVFNNSRNYSALSFYSEAEIERFEIVSVLDERTSEVCLTMNGKILEVGKAIDKYKEYDNAENKEDVKDVHPWLSYTKGVVHYGDFVIDDKTTGADLQAMGIDAPPYHALCRTTIVPII